ncbi:MAG: beta-lactamase domain protein [Thermoleophilia bacterium]|nr:beta-lactamase domain protein [Thermoleophilia bacterium]
MAGTFDGTITWVGHGTFLLEAAGQRILIDAFVDNCPTTPDRLKGEGLGHLDAILLTHGHMDHVADIAAHQGRTGAKVAGMVELIDWLGGTGVDAEHLVDFGIGGTIELGGGIEVTMTYARHSSSVPNGSYAGTPTGFVIALPGGFTIYHSGDTDVFGDMALIRELHEPDLAILSIGGHYTMGPKGAAKAVELLGVRHVIGGHFGTFPPLAGTPQALRELVAPLGVHVHVLEPGDSLDGAAVAAVGA